MLMSLCFIVILSRLELSDIIVYILRLQAVEIYNIEYILFYMSM